MAFFGVIPFGPEQLERMTGVQDRKGFYLEDDVEEVQESSPSVPSTEGLSLGERYTNWWDETVRPNVGGRMPQGFWDFYEENPTINQAIGAGARALGGALNLSEPTELGDSAYTDAMIRDQRATQQIPASTPAVPAEPSPAPTEPRLDRPVSGLITQAEAKPTSLAEAQARGQKTFWVGDQEKLAVTAEQLADFKASDAYDPNSGKSALSQWSSAWESPEVAPEAPEATRRDVRDILIEEEGMKLTPYDDPGGGRRTVGVGHQLGVGEEERDLSDIEAMDTLDTDISKAFDAVDRLAEKFDVGEIPSELRDELMMMAFQMGATGLSKFKKMWGAMKNQDWGEMVAQMADSRWAKSQTPERAARTIDRVATLMGV